ncbi:hypothetical protein EJP77_18700 [Paenibacillus zeisoli]|uniref:Uncharacterized protein n=1 Tax=Paenibacillus zeisoli TaxID=2496267 RepID=A0A3S1B3E6_9BACL|nr:hypothetical protein [Paenibacillus zeisoli]RUT28046.1 hypothetical protein EJP77_18700 [Paenibacillus zeisoli]
MKNVKKSTDLIYYKIYKNNVSGSDYWNWAYKLLETGIESNQLYMLASMNESENEFKYQDYFQRTLNDLNINKPEFEECARIFVGELCLEILNNSRNLFDVVKDIFKVSVELEHPLYLSNGSS